MAINLISIGFFVLIYMTALKGTSATHTCKASISADFSKCKSPFSGKKSFSKDTEDGNSRSKWYQGFCRKNNNVSGLPSHDKCVNKPQSSICYKSYRAIVVDLMPHTFQMTKTLQDMMRYCCKGCGDVCPGETLTQMSNISAQDLVKTDILFPILAHDTTSRLYDFYFLPILHAPNAVFITEKPSKRVLTDKLVKSCGNLWPLLTICLLMAFISGFIAWLMETASNEGEFPRAFRHGLFEGFWWSFISMTTVGYGDKAPKTLAGRLFSVAWILVGITVCSMFTASLTTEITKTITPSTPSMQGKRIGALKHRLYDTLIISKNGGLLLEVEHKSVKDGIDSLLRFLHNETISGFVVDIQTFHYYKTLDVEDSEEKKKSRVPLKPRDLIKTEIGMTGDKLSYGALFRDENMLNFFREYFEQNKLILETCTNLKNNERNVDLADEEFILNPNGGLFYLLVYILVGCIAFILVAGAVYEYWRKQQEMKTMPRNHGITLGPQ